MIAEIENMSVAERIRLVEEIWDSIAATPDEIPAPPEQIEELKRRAEEYYRTKDKGAPWEDVKARIEKRMSR